jgi:hypothetical protein
MTFRVASIAIVTSLMVAPAYAPADAQDPSRLREVTVSGTVELIRDTGLEGCELCEACDECLATHVLLRTPTGRIEVHLAPSWFLDRFEFSPAIGETLSIAGTRARVPKGRGVAAHEVRTGRMVITLRDEHGLPLWRHVLTEASEPVCDRSRR